MEIISICNHKGGVGKTTTAVNVAAALSRSGRRRVLLVDLDPQANATKTLGVDTSTNTYEAMIGEDSLHPVNVQGSWDATGAVLDLAGAELDLARRQGRESVLSELLDEVEGYHYVVIDCPPSLGLLTVNALTASSRVIIPVLPEILALQGLSDIAGIIQKVWGSESKAVRAVVTRYDGRKVLSRQVVDAVEDFFKGKVYKTRIRENVALAEAPANLSDIFRYDEKSHGAEDYSRLAEEIEKDKGGVTI
jgi:chromosome partitioning protein